MPRPPIAPDELRVRVFWGVLHLGAGLMAITLIAYGVAYLTRGHQLLAAVEFGSVVCTAAAYVIAARRRDPLVGIRWLSLISWATLATIVPQHGGLTAPSLTWLVLIAPLIVLAGERMAWYIVGATVVYVALLYVAHERGWLAQGTPVPLAQRALSAVVITLLFSVFAWLVLRWRNRLADELEVARDEAMEANHLKDRFIAHLNHEIRTPMNALITAAELLSRSERTGQERTLVDAIYQSSRHLRALVDDVLDHARLEAGAVKLESQLMSLNVLVRAVGDMFAPAAGAKGLRFVSEIMPGTPDMWFGDALRVRQIVANLVSNAIKMTARGSVAMRVSAQGPQGPVLVDVVDTGPGLSDELRARLFQPYVQGSEPKDFEQRSSGLGLSICRDLVLLMGGSIDVHSAPGEGARFSVSLPLQAHATVAHPTEGVPSMSGGLAWRVLLVEDDPVNRLVMQHLLEDLGMSVMLAVNGEQALQVLEDGAVDLVLMDCQMPVLDGVEATRRWRRREQLAGRSRVPIVALTGDADDEARDRCLEAGMDRVLVKPVQRDELVKRLHDMVSQSVGG